MTDTTGRRGNRDATPATGNGTNGTRRRTAATRLDRHDEHLSAHDRHLATHDARFGTVDLAIQAVDSRVTSTGMRLATIDRLLGGRIDAVEQALTVAQQARADSREDVFVTALIEAELTNEDIARILVGLSDLVGSTDDFDFTDVQLVVAVVRTIDEVRKELAEHTRRLDNIESDVEEVGAKVSRHGTRLDNIEGDATRLTTRVTNAEESVTGLRRDVDAQGDDIEDAHDRISGIRLVEKKGHLLWFILVGAVVFVASWLIGSTLSYTSPVTNYAVDKAGKVTSKVASIGQLDHNFGLAGFTAGAILFAIIVAMGFYRSYKLVVPARTESSILDDYTADEDVVETGEPVRYSELDDNRVFARPGDRL